MKKIGIFAVVALFATVLTLIPDVAMAAGADAGATLISDVNKLVKGSMGTIVGLGVALFGLYTWIVKQETWGIMMIIGGVAVTAFPGVFDSMRAGFANSLEDVSASTTNANQN